MTTSPKPSPQAPKRFQKNTTEREAEKTYSQRAREAVKDQPILYKYQLLEGTPKEGQPGVYDYDVYAESPNKKKLVAYMKDKCRSETNRFLVVEHRTRVVAIWEPGYGDARAEAKRWYKRLAWMERKAVRDNNRQRILAEMRAQGIDPYARKKPAKPKVKRPIGRPKGSKNKPKPLTAVVAPDKVQGEGDKG